MYGIHVAARVLHILAGSLGLIFGFVAIYAAKGAWLHRKSGLWFVYAMVAVGLVGAVMAAIWGRQPASNIPMGLLAPYFALTALTAVRPPARGLVVDQALLGVAFVVAAGLFTAGIVAASSPHGRLGGMPAPAFFIFGSSALLAGLGDLRMIRAGGSRSLRGVPRITRHLWRMCVALIIAAFSFFIGQAKVIPPQFRIMPLLAVPPFLVVFALFYWLWRVRIRRSIRGLAGLATAETKPG